MTAPVAAAPSPDSTAYALERSGRLLIARFSEPHDVLSWAIVGGGIGVAEAVVWTYVRGAELSPAIDARLWLEDTLASSGLTGAVGFLTSRNLDRFVEAAARSGDVSAHAVATVGLSNALRAGDPPGPLLRPGTINILCRVDRALSPEGLLEASAIATEAKAVAVLEEGIVSRRTGKTASGTGTDCIVVAAPRRGPADPYAGKHTDVGAAIGAAVESAVRRGVRDWIEENGTR
ncbi:MAG TPA: adenosylcobinamide amidohydrolase [Polyangiaceae bacterium]|jgi:adenosylcobinamide amidohydrolase